MKNNLKLIVIAVLLSWTAGSASALDKLNGYYCIGNGDQLIEFAGIVNGGEPSANAILTADIDLNGKTYVPIGVDGDNRYRGTFNGQGYRIKNMSIVGSKKEQGMFNVVAGATIKNLILDSSCDINSGDCTAALVGCCNGNNGTILRIENVGVECDVTGTGPNAAAFVGCNYGGDRVTILITNCYNIGNIKANRESAVFSGWFGNNGNSRVTNCWSTGTVTGQDGSNSFGRGISSSQFVNSYDLSSNSKIDATVLEGYDANWMSNGTLREHMGDGWYQSYGYTEHPVPFVDPIYVSKSDGYHQIGTAEQLIWFAKYVSGYASFAKAQLTADIDMTDQTWMPIGSNESRFCGVFDGQYHLIDHVTYSGGEKVGLFGVVSGGATIKNFVAGPNNNIQGTSKVGGIIGCIDGQGVVTLQNVGHEGYIRGTGNNCCPMIGVIMDKGPSLRLYDCYNTGDADAGGESAIISGWLGGYSTKDRDGEVQIHGFWNTGEVKTGVDGGQKLWRTNAPVSIERVYSNYGSSQGEQAINADDLSSGAFAFLLNGQENAGVWRQTLSAPADAHPTLLSSHGLVYANGYLYCDGLPKPGSVYENEEKDAIRDAHNFNDWGFCNNSHDEKICNDLQPDFITPDGEGNYLIGTEAQLNWFAHRVNGHGSLEPLGTINAKLTADIDYSDQQAMIGKESGIRFKGIFDGQGHKITIGYNMDSNNLALFRYIEGATIKNLIVDGSISTNGTQMGGLVSVSNEGSVIRNIVVAVNMTSSHSGDGTHGGLIAVAHNVPTIENVAFVGSINASNDYGTCGMIGYAHSGGSIHYRNCFVGGTLTLTGDNNRVFGRNGEYCDNCYSTLGITKLNNADRFDGADVTSSQISNGELAFLLNGKVNGGETWYQLIGTEAYPMPFVKDGAKVYVNNYYCDGYGKSYQNTIGGVEQDPHNYNDWGFCDNSHDAKTCDDQQMDFVTLTDGYYQVGNYKQLNWFATLVNRGTNTTAKAKLTDDIIMESAFPCIGNSNHRFSGEIDGQRHLLKNWIVTEATEKKALVRCAEGGLTLKNMTMASSCSLQSTATVAGFVADINGANGTVTLENLGNEGKMNGGTNTGGIAGCNYNGNIVITMKNCYNTGSITATAQGGALSGWLGTDARVYNCYNTGSITKGVGLFRGNGTYYNENTYSTVNNNGGGDNNAEAKQILSADKFSDGTVFAGLFDYNENDVNGNVWRMEFSGIPHPVLYDADLVLKEDFPNRFVSKDNVNLTLERTTVADTWNTICLPFALDEDGVKDLFGESAQVAELAGSEGSTLNFTTVPAIAAGKAYLVKPSKEMTPKELTGVNLVADAPEAITEGGYAFTGIYEPTTIVANDLFVAAENKLVPSNGEGKLKAFRAYFHNTTGAESRFTDFVIDNIATGLKTVMPAFTEVQGTVFDLQGRRTVRPVKGLYIVGGKKMVVK